MGKYMSDGPDDRFDILYLVHQTIVEDFCNGKLLDSGGRFHRGTPVYP